MISPFHSLSLLRSVIEMKILHSARQQEKNFCISVLQQKYKECAKQVHTYRHTRWNHILYVQATHVAALVLLFDKIYSQTVHEIQS